MVKQTVIEDLALEERGTGVNLSNLDRLCNAHQSNSNMYTLGSQCCLKDQDIPILSIDKMARGQLSVQVFYCFCQGKNQCHNSFSFSLVDKWVMGAGCVPLFCSPFLSPMTLSLANTHELER